MYFLDTFAGTSRYWLGNCWITYKVLFQLCLGTGNIPFEGTEPPLEQGELSKLEYYNGQRRTESLPAKSTKSFKPIIVVLKNVCVWASWRALSKPTKKHPKWHNTSQTRQTSKKTPKRTPNETKPARPARPTTTCKKSNQNDTTPARPAKTHPKAYKMRQNSQLCAAGEKNFKLFGVANPKLDLPSFIIFYHIYLLYNYSLNL